MSQEHTKNMESKTLDIIGLYLLTERAAYKVAPGKLRSANSISTEMSVFNSKVI